MSFNPEKITKVCAIRQKGGFFASSRYYCPRATNQNGGINRLALFCLQVVLKPHQMAPVSSVNGVLMARD